jgi:hypothetical protein
MSHSVSYNYELKHQEYLKRQVARDQRHQEYLERQAARGVRQQQYFDRIQENVSRYRDQYVARFADMVQRGFEQYLPAEFAQIRSRLAELNNFLNSDPEHAREMSLQIGAEISSLQSMARSAQHEFEARERERQQELAVMRRKATSELGQFLHSLVAEIRDPIEQDFAFDKLKAIQSEYEDRVVNAQDLPQIKDELSCKVKAISVEASLLAKDWKNRKAKEILVESQNTLIDIHREQVATEVGLHPQAVQTMLASLDALRHQVSERGSSMGDVQKQLADAAEKVDATVVDENCRRMVVRAILESLQKAGFVVGTPQRQSGEKDEVVILARKPSGAEASFRVTIDGVMVYKFDHYDGMKCKSDIDQVLPMLQEIYGIELSNERVLWQNPDRISKSARPIDDESKEQSRG